MASGAFAQERGKVRGGLDFGYCIPSDGGGGAAVNLNLGYNLQDNMNVGVRWGVAAMAKVDQWGETGTAKANFNYLATFNYYFNSGTSPVAPFVGCGAGLYVVAGASVNTSSGSVGTDNKFGGMLMGGVEIGKLRVAVEYNLVPSTDVQIAVGSNADDKIKNGYLAITTGFYFGGGKWRK